MSKSNQEAVKKYQKGRDAIMLRPSLEHGARIRAAAAADGKSVQAWIFAQLAPALDGSTGSAPGDDPTAAPER